MRVRTQAIHKAYKETNKFFKALDAALDDGDGDIDIKAELDDETWWVVCTCCALATPACRRHWG